MKSDTAHATWVGWCACYEDLEATPSCWVLRAAVAGRTHALLQPCAACTITAIHSLQVHHYMPHPCEACTITAMHSLQVHHRYRHCLLFTC